MDIFSYRNHLNSNEKPWLAKARTNKITQLKVLASPVPGRLAFVFDGENMKSWDDFDMRFSSAFEFPFWYGENPDAFDEVMRNLAWLEYDQIFILILNAHQVMIQPHTEWTHCSPTFAVELLGHAAEFWNIEASEGEGWDHPAKPFHVLFHLPLNSPVDLDLTEVRLG